MGASLCWKEPVALHKRQTTYIRWQVISSSIIEHRLPFRRKLFSATNQNDFRQNKHLNLLQNWVDARPTEPVSTLLHLHGIFQSRKADGTFQSVRNLRQKLVVVASELRHTSTSACRHLVLCSSHDSVKFDPINPLLFSSQSFLFAVKVIITTRHSTRHRRVEVSAEVPALCPWILVIFV